MAAVGTAPVGTEPKANSGKAGSWAKDHKVIVVLIGVSVVALLMLLRRSTSKANAGATGAASDPNAMDPYGGAGAVNPAQLGMSDPAGVFDPNSLAGLLTQLLAGQASLGTQLGADYQTLHHQSTVIDHKVTHHPRPKPKPLPKRRKPRPKHPAVPPRQRL